MRIGFLTVVVLSLTMFGNPSVSAREDTSANPLIASPREIYEALNSLRIDPTKIYMANDLRLRRDGISFTFSDGTIGFLEAFDGRITGAVFSGHGHVNANLRDPAERQSLAHFLGVPLLDLGFSGAYLRFDDGSADELIEQLRRSGANPVNDDDFVSGWNKALANLNPGQSTRLLLDWTSVTPVPFFYSELLDDRLGSFDVLIDGRRTDSVLIGQERWANGNPYYDMWTSFQGTETPANLPRAFVPVSYTIDTTINPDKTLEGTTTVELQVGRPGERGIAFELSRFLKVQSAQGADGTPLDFFQNDTLAQKQLAERGNDVVLVFLPESARTGQPYRIRMTYRGSVISDAGNGVYFVGDRGIWYPNVGVGMGQFSTFDTIFRWPKKLQLVATGAKVEEHEENEQRVGHWRSEGRTAVSGFNLGDYSVQNMDSVNGIKIQVAANSDLERSIINRLRSQDTAGAEEIIPVRPNRRLRTPATPPPNEAPLLPVAGALKEVGLEISNAIRFEQQWMGPFPYHQLVVSQLPGNVGQGFPGLLYLPSLSFLPVIAQQRSGMSDDSQEAVGTVVPYHEIAHQWWGNVVGWENYRDQWISEGIANYIALVGADLEKPGSHLLAHWLDQYRKALTSPSGGQRSAADEAGPLVHGARLSSSRDPDAYQKIVYGKGTWVFHMLRMMLQDPASKNPDERFIGLLHALVESHRYRPLTTEDFQLAVEHIMIPSMAVEGGHSMDWFFEQFVRSTGIPAYEVEYAVQPGSKGFRVRGKLIQKNVPDDFVLRVPVYGQGQSGKPLLLGYVITSGEETSFQFVATVSPKKLLIDPQMTLLCLPPSASSIVAQ